MFRGNDIIVFVLRLSNRDYAAGAVQNLGSEITIKKHDHQSVWEEGPVWQYPLPSLSVCRQVSQVERRVYVKGVFL